MQERLAIVAVLVAAAAASAGSVRDIRRSPGGTVWAVGDGGLILASEDSGQTWTARAADADANLQHLWIDEPTLWAFGGRAVSGYPGGAGEAVILRSGDGGKTFDPLPAGPAGWAYGGTASDASIALGGQPTPTAPGGVYHSRTAGDRWTAIPLERSGYLCGSAFREFRYGYFVGQNQRIVSLRELQQPQLHPAEIDSNVPLTDAAFRDAETCWAVGLSGTVLQSRPAGQRWVQKMLPIPPRTRSLADFETVDFFDGRGCLIGGGLLGVLFRSSDGGETFTALPAPGPGPVRRVRQLSMNDLLAGGDGGRIWRSTDAGKTWQQVRGPQQTDVLFIVAAGDTSIYPAVVAHARAGLDVAIVYASAPQPLDESAELGTAAVMPGQPLRAAAAAAGAGGAVAFEQVPSLLLDPAAPRDADEAAIIKRWTAALDAPAEEVILRRMVAAIRLYRPRVVATGPAEPGPQGVPAENRLVARLAARAVTQAADAERFDELLAANLPPHKVERLFVGDTGNDHWQPPWNKPSMPTRDCNLRIDATRWPADADATIELLAQRAIWAIGHAGLLDRPARFGGYHCQQADGRLALMTTGLTTERMPRRPLSTAQRMLASAAEFRQADSLDNLATVLAPIMETLTGVEAETNRLLAADRLLLAWARLRAKGRLAESEKTRELFLKHGQSHPLFRRMNVAMLAEWASPEFARQWSRLRTPAAVTPADVGKAIKTFEQWHPWADSPVGMLLAARANQRAGRSVATFADLERLAAEPYPADWRSRASQEQTLLRGKLPDRTGQMWVDAAPAAAEGRIDGKLDEPAWQTAKPVALQTADGTGGEATLQVLRTPADVVLGLRLRRPRGRRWDVAVAIDADRDTWTQLVLDFNEDGQRSEHLLTRYAPPTLLPEIQRGPPPGPIGSWIVKPGRKPPATVFAIQAPRQADDGWWTVEIGLLAQQVQDPRTGAVWNLQVRATADDATETSTYYLRPQEDPRLLPERYALLMVPPPTTP